MNNHKHWLFPLVALVLSLGFYLINPFMLSPEAAKATSVALFMIILWVSEVVPMSVVALMPLVLQPALGIAPIEEVAKAYSNPVVFLFMGGFMIGLAIEKWNLHKRIALTIVDKTGTSGDRIILGFIAATGFLSMWLSNTATTMMMFPIALSVINVMRNHEHEGGNLANFSLVLMLVIAYASNIGGMATLIGTPPNVAFSSLIEKRYGHAVDFFDWMVVCAPLAMVLLFCLYIVLTKWMYPNRIRKSDDAAAYISHELQKMGALNKAESRVLIIFVCTAGLWIFKDLLNPLLPFKLDDNMIALIGAISLFLVPSGERKEDQPVMLLRWSDTSKMAWGILLLFGGGIAMAASLEKAGVMAAIGQWLANFSQLPGFVLVFLVVLISIFLSEVMSNVAQVIVLTPVLAALSDQLHLDPLLLGIPMTLAASAAGMLPMGTPPNAIVFSSGKIPLKSMLKAGLVMNLVSILFITLFCWFVLPLVIRH